MTNEIINNKKVDLPQKFYEVKTEFPIFSITYKKYLKLKGFCLTGNEIDKDLSIINRDSCLFKAKTIIYSNSKLRKIAGNNFGTNFPADLKVYSEFPGTCDHWPKEAKEKIKEFNTFAHLWIAQGFEYHLLAGKRKHTFNKEVYKIFDEKCRKNFYNDNENLEVPEITYGSAS